MHAEHCAHEHRLARGEHTDMHESGTAPGQEVVDAEQVQGIYQLTRCLHGRGRAAPLNGTCTSTQQQVRCVTPCEGCASHEVPVLVCWLNIDVINNVHGSDVRAGSLLCM